MESWNETVDYLKQNGPKIGADSEAGDARARRVVGMYVMFYDHQDEPTRTLLIESVRDYRKQRDEKLNERVMEGDE